MKEKTNTLEILRTFVLIGFLIFFIAYFLNVSIGEWISRENYSTNSEWFKQIGLFMATMVAFERVISFAFVTSKEWQIKKKKQEKRCHRK